MKQPPGGNYRNQPQVPPQWANYPQAGYPPTGLPGHTPGYPTGQVPPPRRPQRKNPVKRNAILLAVGALLIIGAIASAVNGNGKSAKPVAVTASSRATAKTSASASATLDAAAKAENSCLKRPPASGDIYVRTVEPGISPQAQRLGGAWAWDHASGKCLTSVQMVTATAPLGGGNCTQVGYVANNPGYDASAVPAAPLLHVAAHAGPACQAAAPPAPARTTPAVAPPAPAQTTPAAAPPPPSATTATAACHPLTNGGNCYKPGEFCRNADHGASGVAGDGEAITCADNDGWRWEPA